MESLRRGEDEPKLTDFYLMQLSTQVDMSCQLLKALLEVTAKSKRITLQKSFEAKRFSDFKIKIVRGHGAINNTDDVITDDDEDTLTVLEEEDDFEDEEQKDRPEKASVNWGGATLEEYTEEEWKELCQSTRKSQFAIRGMTPGTDLKDLTNYSDAK